VNLCGTLSLPPFSVYGNPDHYFFTKKSIIMDVLVHHIEDVKNMYDCYNRKDIPGILKRLDRDCIWEVMGGKEIPHAGIYHGPEDVKSYFDKLEKNTETREMITEHFSEDGNIVYATGRWSAVVRKNNKPISSIWLMIIEFNDKGKVTHFRDCYDTQTVAKAFG
jgi:uncharacterized protein